MTMRLSQSSLTGTERTLVAVGHGEAGVHVLHRAGRGTLEHGVGRLRLLGVLVLGVLRLLGVLGCRLVVALGLAGGPALLVRLLLALLLGLRRGPVLGPASRPAGASRRPSGPPSRPASGADFWSGRDLGAPVDSVTLPFDPRSRSSRSSRACEVCAAAEAFVWRWSLPKKSHQTLSTLSGSCWYFSYISSTSHSLAPNPDIELSSVDSGTASFASSNARWIQVPVKARPPRARSAGEEGLRGRLIPSGSDTVGSLFLSPSRNRIPRACQPPSIQ